MPHPPPTRGERVMTDERPGHEPVEETWERTRLCRQRESNLADRRKAARPSLLVHDAEPLAAYLVEHERPRMHPSEKDLETRRRGPLFGTSFVERPVRRDLEELPPASLPHFEVLIRTFPLQREPGAQRSQRLGSPPGKPPHLAFLEIRERRPKECRCLLHELGHRLGVDFIDPEREDETRFDSRRTLGNECEPFELRIDHGLPRFFCWDKDGPEFA